MEIEEQLRDFINRINGGLGNYVPFDETTEWPQGRLEELIRMGVLIPTTPSKRILCKECIEDNCPIPIDIEKMPDTDGKVGMFLCRKEGGRGLTPVPMERFKRWEIMAEKLEELGYHILPNSCIEIDLNQFSENKKAGYDFKQEMEALANQGYIKYPSNELATQAARRIRSRLKNTKYASITLTQDKRTLRLDAGVQIIIKK